MATLPERLEQEIARVRDQVMPLYVAIGVEGFVAVSLMRVNLAAATRALAGYDAVEMLQALKELEGHTV